MSTSTVSDRDDYQGERSENSTESLFQGVDLSGITVVLGVGTGRLIALLAEQVAQASGNLLVVAYSKKALADLRSYLREGAVEAPIALMQARPREIPVLSETVDLLVVNGILREVPASKLMAISEEFWRVLVPGGQLRVSDIIEPCEEEYTRTWAERNRIVRKLGKALEKPTALSVDLQHAAMALRSAGFEDLSLVLLPGLFLTDAWVEETVNALRAMAGRLVDRGLRDEVLNADMNRFLETYAAGDQRAAERFVLRGAKVGDLALDMEITVDSEAL
jgi:SAM-dependent methyltransferase